MRKTLLVALVLFLASSALGQQAKLTWIRHVSVERGREADFLRYVTTYTKPMLQKLAAEQKVLGWGVGFPVTLSSDPYTHVIWVALPDWNGAEAIGQAMEAAEAAMSPADLQKMLALESSIRPGSTYDVVLRHVVQADALPAFQPKYIVVDTYAIHPGRNADAVALFNEWAKPIFTSDAVKTRVGPWGLSVEDLPSGEPWTHMVWYFISDLGARDVLDTATMSIEPRRLQGYDVRLRDLSDVSRQRSKILRTITP